MAKSKANSTPVGLPEPEKTYTKPITDTSHTEVVKHLGEQCVRVWTQIKWYSRQRQASAAIKSTMVDSVSGKSSGFSISKRLMSSKHPLVQELAVAKKAVMDFRDSMTIVMAAEVRKIDVNTVVVAEEDSDAPAVNDETEEVSTAVARGLRLIPKSRIQDFWDGFWDRVKVMIAQAKKVQDNLEEIKKFDKELLGDAFDENDYPTDILSAISVQGPVFSNFSVSMDLPPEIYKAQLKDIEIQLSQTIGTAVSHIGNDIIEAFNSLAFRLVNPHVVHPLKGYDLERFAGAELRDSRPAGEEDGVPMYAIVLRIEEEAPGGKGKKQFVETTIKLPEAEWKTILRPTATTKKHKIFTSSVEKVAKLIENFDQVKTMLGEYGKNVNDQLEPVRTMLAKLTRSAQGSLEDATDILRDTAIYRKDLADALSQVVSGVQSVLVETTTTGRRLNAKYVKGEQAPEDKK